MSPSHSKRPIYSPESKLDIRDGADWFQETYSYAAARHFLQSINRCVAHIADRPEAYPVVYKNMRKAVVLTLPYLVYYVYEDRAVEVLAVMHQRRNLKDWQVRVK